MGSSGDDILRQQKHHLKAEHYENCRLLCTNLVTFLTKIIAFILTNLWIVLHLFVEFTKKLYFKYFGVMLWKFFFNLFWSNILVCEQLQKKLLKGSNSSWSQKFDMRKILSVFTISKKKTFLRNYLTIIWSYFLLIKVIVDYFQYVL